LLENNKTHIAEIKQLNQEKRAAIEKINLLEQELRKVDENSYRIYKDLAR